MGEIGCTKSLLVLALINSRLLWLPVVCMGDVNLSANTGQLLAKCGANQKQRGQSKNCAWQCSQHASESTTFMLKSFMVMQTTGKCDNLLVAKAIARRFLFSTIYIWGQFHLQIASNLQQPLANWFGNILVCQVSEGCSPVCRLCEALQTSERLWGLTKALGRLVIIIHL